MLVPAFNKSGSSSSTFVSNAVDILTDYASSWYTADNDGYLYVALASAGTGMLQASIQDAGETTTIYVSVTPGIATSVYIKKGMKIQKRNTEFSGNGAIKFWKFQ